MTAATSSAIDGASAGPRVPLLSNLTFFIVLVVQQLARKSRWVAHVLIVSVIE